MQASHWTDLVLLSALEENEIQLCEYAMITFLCWGFLLINFSQSPGELNIWESMPIVNSVVETEMEKERAQSAR